MSEAVNFIEKSIDGLFDAAQTNPCFRGVTNVYREDTTGVEEVIIPEHYAYQGFPGLEKFEDSLLVLQRVSAQGLYVARHILKLVYRTPKTTGMNQHERIVLNAIDNTGLYSRTLVFGENFAETDPVSGPLGDISMPLGTIHEFVPRANKYTDTLARRILAVAVAAEEPNQFDEDDQEI